MMRTVLAFALSAYLITLGLVLGSAVYGRLDRTLAGFAEMFTVRGQ